MRGHALVLALSFRVALGWEFLYFIEIVGPSMCTILGALQEPVSQRGDYVFFVHDPSLSEMTRVLGHDPQLIFGVLFERLEAA